MNKRAPLVSIIVSTYNSSATLEACLQSIINQTYLSLELIVVDNYSTDNTATIAMHFADKLFVKGPERSAQRNYGVSKAAGEYVMIIDCDMELTPRVVQTCVEHVLGSPETGAVIIPEESFGKGFWARCKQLERSFYLGVDWVEAARFFDKKIYLQAGGYNETMVSGEDWDLSQRVGQLTHMGRINEFIRHNEGHLRLFKTLKKKMYYAGQFNKYTAQKSSTASHGKQPVGIVLRRFGLFFSHPTQLLSNPFVGIGMLFMKLCEFGCGAVGYMTARVRVRQEADDE